ncbi:MAG TPA: hypothetical protein VLT45_22035, partial [Kofleriaceae bacterium]|nr:hypothetical protein [Kofleriaceae bacterium]
KSRHQIKGASRPLRIGFLWREAADFVGQMHKQFPEDKGLEILKAIKAQHEAASNCLVAVIKEQFGALPALLAVWQALTAKMARIPELEFVGRGMLEAYEQQGVFFADVH